MPITHFPDPRQANEEGIVAVGGDLHPQSLMLAYWNGIFPWPIEGLSVLPWFCPAERAILDFSKLHLPRSLVRAQKASTLRLSIDQDFATVIRACAEARRDSGTWLTDEMIAAYEELHRLGHAHSVEAWAGPELVGGVYGVDVGGVFAGESMFFKRANASKLALLHLIAHLREAGAEWMDIQVMTPHMRALGAELIPRDRFLDRLERARARKLQPFRRT